MRTTFPSHQNQEDYSDNALLKPLPANQSKQQNQTMWFKLRFSISTIFIRILIFVCGTLFGCIANAEGALRIFDCSIVQQCDADDQCSPLQGTVRFELEPQQLDPGGAGSYRLIYEDMDVIMQAVSDAGPFTWVTDEKRHTLLVNADDELLWHQLEFFPALSATSTLLTCAFRQ